jgi:nitrogen fixation protein FixH
VEVQDIVAFQKIKKDEFVDGNDLQAWLSSNLDSDQTLKVKKNIFNFISAYTTEEAKIQTQTIQSINPQQIDAKVSKGEGNWIEKLTGDDGLLSRLNVEIQFNYILLIN